MRANDHINAWYDLAMANGALGGGFLMFYTSDRARLRRTMREAGLQEVRFRFEGTKILTMD